MLTGRNQYKLKVVDGSSTAWSKAVVLIVEKKSEITTWDVDDYDFHFIAYFTPNDYLWLRNLLMHDPKFSTDEWFLGCFMQVLNDNHFDSGEDNIPWTDSLTKIFSWGNRLENHMGHFGPWWADESETADDMINREGKSKVKACMDIIVLMYNLRSFFIHQTAENNFGMMINLAWHFSWDEYSGDVAMNLKCAYIW